MEIRIWLATRHRETWVSATEIIGVALVLLAGPQMTFVRVAALLLLAHLGYKALTSLPMGEVPGRPTGAPERRNQTLRTRVVAFLNEVRRIETYAERARMQGRPDSEVEANVRTAEQRVMAAAAAVAKVTGRTETARQAG